MLITSGRTSPHGCPCRGGPHRCLRARGLWLGSDEGGGGASGDGSAADLDAALEEGGTITYWTWTPSAEAQVAAFEKQYPNVDVKLVNAGTGNDHYTKLQNAIKAGSGGPDVAQVEYQALPQFALPGDLVDLTQYGFDELRRRLHAVHLGGRARGDGLYGLPQDSGPMALFYNQEVFDEHGLEVPTTWDEYIDRGQAAQGGRPLRVHHQRQRRPRLRHQHDLAGRRHAVPDRRRRRSPSTCRTRAPRSGPPCGTSSSRASWPATSRAGPRSGTRRSATAPSRPSHSGRGHQACSSSPVPDGAGKWRVAPMPTYDGEPATAENGGGTQSVLEQSNNPALAAAFVRWLNHDEGIEPFLASGGFPATVADLEDPTFVDKPSDYFGGQPVNQVLTEAAGHVVEGWQYLPYQLYANTIFGDTVGKAYQDHSDLNAGLLAWQDALVEYGNGQGFSVN